MSFAFGLTRGISLALKVLSLSKELGQRHLMNIHLVSYVALCCLKVSITNDPVKLTRAP